MIKLRLYVPLDKNWVISEMLFPANLFAFIEKQPQKYTTTNLG